MDLATIIEQAKGTLLQEEQHPPTVFYRGVNGFFRARVPARDTFSVRVKCRQTMQMLQSLPVKG